MRVCVCACACVFLFNMCLGVCLKVGRHFKRLRLMLLVEYAQQAPTQHHPEPPPLLCGMAIIKMIYLTIGPRLRD